MIHIVGVADMKVSAEPGDTISTHALGSCLGIAIHDPEAVVGGMLHAMLPLSSIDPALAAKNPWTFIDSGVPLLFKECYKHGAKKERIIIVVAGGASLQQCKEEDYFQIGERNLVVLRKLLWKNGLLMKAHDVGGNISRTMSLEIGSGDVIVKSNGTEKRLYSGRKSPGAIGTPPDGE